jgi:hypothetical protein
MHEQKANDHRHREEMNEPRALKSAEQHDEPRKLHRLPHRNLKKPQGSAAITPT